MDNFLSTQPISQSFWAAPVFGYRQTPFGYPVMTVSTRGETLFAVVVIMIVFCSFACIAVFLESKTPPAPIQPNKPVDDISTGLKRDKHNYNYI